MRFATTGSAVRVYRAYAKVNAGENKDVRRVDVRYSVVTFERGTEQRAPRRSARNVQF